MDGTMVSASAAVAGATVGGLASFGGSWLTQWLQLRDQGLERDRARREALFAEFIDEAARLYGDALGRQNDEPGHLVRLYALAARMRLVASAPVIAAAERAMRAVIEAYLGPNRTLQELHALAGSEAKDFLAEFSEACRAELGAGPP